IEGLDISRLHVFTYSERPGTKALEIDYVVDPEEKHRRTRRMLALSERKLADFIGRFAGSRRPVLLEHSKPGQPMSGFTDNYIRVEIADADPALDNHIVEAELGQATEPDSETIPATIIKQ
ncbi:MAG: tRNA (N(6)-L-threonylcarbamoyladenosine(37)-C(2))-methylthiotransferase MtaB, partial [Muribaculaceae bacterium]|nr:tRNA (N(6)-L-threonylcarbamoyladenosine(37)-C(2))-methylthiotransferase MtaB [Muribaculaceae bacterium]